jgi:hypothetical protein
VYRRSKDRGSLLSASKQRNASLEGVLAAQRAKYGSA